VGVLSLLISHSTSSESPILSMVLKQSCIS